MLVAGGGEIEEIWKIDCGWWLNEHLGFLQEAGGGGWCPSLLLQWL